MAISKEEIKIHLKKADAAIENMNLGLIINTAVKERLEEELKKYK